MLTTLLWGLPLLALGWMAWTWNRLIALRAASHAAWASVDALLKRRANLIPNLVALVKGTMTFEADTLTQVTAARGAALAASDVAERSRAETAVTHGMRQLLALVESYPELRANENVLRLQQQLTETENDIASARRYFNAVVRDYNILRESFPNLIVARLLGFGVAGYFTIDDDERDAPGARL